MDPPSERTRVCRHPERSAYTSPVWAGVLPITTVPGDPVPDGDHPELPGHVALYRRPRT